MTPIPMHCGVDTSPAKLLWITLLTHLIFSSKFNAFYHDLELIGSKSSLHEPQMTNKTILYFILQFQTDIFDVDTLSNAYI